MKNAKSWYQSKTIWGIIIAAVGYTLSTVLQVPSVALPENADFDQLKAYADAVAAAKGNASVIASQVVAALGTILAIIGRVKADATIA
jgi:hypothetical protein